MRPGRASCDATVRRRRTRRALRGRGGAARNGRHGPRGRTLAGGPRWGRAWARGSRAAGTYRRTQSAPSPPRDIEISNRCRMHPFGPLRITNRCGSRCARAPQQSTQPCFTCTAVSTRSHRLPTALSLNSQSGRELSLSSEPTNHERHNNHHSSELHSTYNIPFGQARARAARRAAAPTCRRVVLSAKSRRAHMPTPSRMAAKARQISGRPWQDGLWFSHPPSRSRPCSRR